VQCSSRHDVHTCTCSSHAGKPSTRHSAVPCSTQKSSPHTEQRCEQASQPQWSCRQIPSVAGGRPQCGHASDQPDTPLSDRCAANVDRKSTRLNSSHRTISYAVFCLKK